MLSLLPATHVVDLLREYDRGDPRSDASPSLESSEAVYVESEPEEEPGVIEGVSIRLTAQPAVQVLVP